MTRSRWRTMLPGAAAPPCRSSTRRPSRWSTTSTARSRPSPCRNTPSCPRSASTRPPSGPRAMRSPSAPRPTRSSPTCICSTRRRKPRACASIGAIWSRRAGWSRSSPASKPGSICVGEYVKSHAQSHGVALRHYLISSGLVEIIEGTSIFKRFHNVFASEYWFEAYDLPYPKRVITDTGKTQYLFRINKGVEDLGESINQHMPEAARPIPFANMIYFGDGDTDVPSMAVMRKNGGHAVAVYPPAKSKRQVRRAVQGRPLRFLRACRLPRRLRPLQAHLPAARPHPRRHPRAGGDVAHGAGVGAKIARAGD